METNGEESVGKCSKISKTSSTNSFIQLDVEEEGEIVDNSQADQNSPGVIFEQDDVFAIDLNPENEDENDALVKATMGSKLNKTLVGLGSPGDILDSTKGASRYIVCFNCEGAHRLDECTEPRDARRIQRNRSFHNQRKEGGMRMHSTPKSLEHKPGEVSDKLRKALGINRDDIPEWIFRMRQKGLFQGYPPGWMKVAMEPDTFKFIEGNDDAKSEQPLKINPEKLVCYPGFNHFDKKLKDIPRGEIPYRIPNFEEFKKMYPNWVQENISPTDDVQEIVVKKSEFEKSRKKKNIDAGDIKIIEQTTTESFSILSPPPTAPDLQNLQQPLRTDTPNHVESVIRTPAGRPNIIAIPGTPIILDRSSSSSQDIEKPDLSKWAEGIVPFQHFEENTGKKGFLKEMMSMLNEFKQQEK